MDRKFTRRDVLRTLGVGTAVGVAGCTGGGGGDGAGGDDGSTPTGGEAETGTGGDDATGGGADADRQESQPGTTTIAGVTDVLSRPPLEIQVLRGERVETVEAFGFERPPEEGNVAYDVTLVFKNAADAYVSFVTDGLAMLADDRQVTDLLSFAERTSASFGGVALAPGEVRRFDLSFEVPDGASRYGLAGSFRVRSLPGTSFDPVEAVVVDFAQGSGTAPVGQTLDVPFRSFDESVVFQGVELSVREVFFTDEAGGRTAPEGSEFGVVDIAGTNDSSFPLAFGIGAGGFAFQDANGTTYTSSGGARDGRVGERRILSLANGLRQGESAEGVQVALLPAGVEPLYVSYTPPPPLWISSGSVSEHKFFWQAR